MYLKVSRHIINLLVKYKSIWTYQIAFKGIRMYPNVLENFTKRSKCILYYSGLLGIVFWLAAERAIYDPKWLWDNEVLSSFLFQFWTLCETKNDTITTAHTTAAGCELFQATVARCCLVVLQQEFLSKVAGAGPKPQHKQPYISSTSSGAPPGKW